MPHIPNTPESLISRSDSKNPLTTCRGLTSSGRPCRRALATGTSPTSATLNSIVAVAQDANDDNVMNAAFFCHQHKNQATKVLHVKQVLEVQNRSSIDTLVERFGVLNVKEDIVKVKRLPQHLHRGHDRGTTAAQSRPPPTRSQQSYRSEKAPLRRGKSLARPSIWSLFCCFSSPDFDDHDDDYDSYDHHRNHHADVQYNERPEMTMSRHTRVSPPITRPPRAAQPSTPRSKSFAIPSPSASPTYDFSNAASLIPTHLPSSTRTALLAELTKPLSQHDEAGYIYIFQLDPSSTPASSPTKPHSSANSGKLLVKIGRTNNVHRRLHSWSKQCGYSLTLLRFYPYISSTPSSSPTKASHQSPQPIPHTLPYTHRIERLIHLELSAQRVKQEKCSACGREHKEWFEIEASREGVRAMDEIVRRWVGWGEWMGERAEEC